MMIFKQHAHVCAQTARSKAPEAVDMRLNGSAFRNQLCHDISGRTHLKQNRRRDTPNWICERRLCCSRSDCPREIRKDTCRRHEIHVFWVVRLADSFRYREQTSYDPTTHTRKRPELANMVLRCRIGYPQIPQRLWEPLVLL